MYDCLLSCMIITTTYHHDPINISLSKNFISNIMHLYNSIYSKNLPTIRYDYDSTTISIL